MGVRSRHALFSWFSLVSLLGAVLLPGSLHAQQCDLMPLLSKPVDVALRTVDAMPTSTYLPAGGTGEMLVRALPSATIRIFEVDTSDPNKWKSLSENLVTSVKPLPEKSHEGRGFLTSDSSIVRFVVPRRGISLWDAHNFVVRVCTVEEKTQKTQNAWALVTAPVSSTLLARTIALVAIVLMYGLFAAAIWRRQRVDHPLAIKWPDYKPRKPRGFLEYLDPVVMTAGVFNQGSIQKLQVLFFSLLVAGMLLSLVLTLGMLTDLSYTVALLLGISAVGAAVGTKTANNKERLTFDNWSWLVRKKVLPINKEGDPKWSDLVMTGREFDVYKLQTLIFSVVVAAALLVSGEDRLGSFDVPPTLLGILGLSQVIYVAGALVRPPSISDVDEALTRLRNLETKLRAAIAKKSDTDDKGELLQPPATPPAVPGENARKQYDAQAKQVEIMLESCLEVEVDSAKLAPDLS